MGFQNIRKNELDIIDGQNSIFQNPSIGLLDKKPNVCKAYYHIDKINSTTFNGTDNIKAIIGEDSPLRFQQILDFVLYGFTESQKTESDEDDIGYETIKINTSVILPNTIEPIEGDLLVLKLDNGAQLYIVTEVEEILDRKNPYYRIVYEALIPTTNNKYQYMLENQIIETFKYYDNPLSNRVEISKIDDYNTYIDLFNILYKLQSLYMTVFYKKDLNSLLADMDGTYVYSSLVTEFVNRNNLFRNHDFEVDLIIKHEIPTTKDFNNYEYKRSLYNLYSNNKPITDHDLIFSKSLLMEMPVFSFFYRSKVESVINIEKTKILYGIINDLKDTPDALLAHIEAFNNVIDFRTGIEQDYLDILDPDSDVLVLSNNILEKDIDDTDIGAFLFMPILIDRIFNFSTEIEKEEMVSVIANIFG